MAIVLQFDAYVCEAEAPYTNILSLGKARTAIVKNNSCVAGTSGYCSDYNELTSKVFDGELLGSSTLFFARDVDIENLIGRARLYFPSVNYISVPSIYRSGDYRIKLVNASGNYLITSSLDTNSGYGTETGYDENGLIGSVSGGPHPLVWEVSSNRAVYTGTLVVSSIVDGKIPVDAEVLTLEYWSSANFRENYWQCRDIGGSAAASTIEFYNGCTVVEYNEDPYEEGGTSGTGGGTGTFSGTGDAIAIPALPTLSATDAGFITLFNPTAAQMMQLANYMWTNPLFDLENWRKIFANPMDAILGLSIVPVNVPSGGSREVKVGNISTGVSMTVASSQYVEVDCGTLNVQEFWGAYLDYEPYTTAEIYLPYCGTHAIKVDDIMGKSVHVVYHVDVLSGGCCCYVQCGGTVLYTFLGHCSVSIPVTGDNWTRVVNGAIQIAGSVGTMVATGGASFGTGIPNIASAAANLVKPAIEKSGAMGGPGGILAVQTPYLILTRPRQALPEGQNTFTGYPSFITETLGSLTGYTKVYSVHLEEIPATDSEITEIENLLKGGVIF